MGCVEQEHRVDRVMEIGQREAEESMRALARVEGIFAGAAKWPYRVPLTHCSPMLHSDAGQQIGNWPAACNCLSSAQ